MYPGTLAIPFEDLPKDPSRSSAGSTASSSKYVPKPLDITSTIWTTNPNSNYVDASLSSLSQASTTTRRKVKSLLDTGSLAGDFVSFWTLNDQHLAPFIITNTPKVVCSGLDNTCYNVSSTIALLVSYFTSVSSALVDLTPIPAYFSMAYISSSRHLSIMTTIMS